MWHGGSKKKTVLDYQQWKKAIQQSNTPSSNFKVHKNVILECA